MSPVASIALVLLALCAEHARAETTLRDAQFLLGGGTAPPGDTESGWELIRLPDRWHETRPDASGPGWYRLRFATADPPRGRQAVYLDHATMNAAVFLNGEWLGSGGRMDPPVAQSWNRPLLFEFSPRQLRAGENVVDVQLYRLADCYGALGPVRIGDLAALAPLHASRLFWRVELPRASTIVCLVVALGMLAFYAGSGDAAYGAFAAFALLFGVANLNYHVRDIPFSSQIWEAMVCAASILAACAFAFFAHRLAGWRLPRLEIAVAAVGLASLALFAVDHGVFHRLYNSLSAAAIGIAAWTLVPLLSHARRGDRAMLLVYPVLAAAVLAILAHDFAIQLRAIDQPAPHLMPLAMPLLVIGLGAMLTRRFVRAFRAAEGKLEASVARLRAFERDHLLAAERERIVREMHDGIGGQLVRTLSMVERRGVDPQEITESLRGALEEMRLVIDSLDPGARDLAALLADFRDRLGPRVERCGLRFEWAVRDVPDAPLGAEALLDVLRILQEAVTNALRHAKATRIRVDAAAALDDGGRDGVRIELSDDGIGLAPGARTGRGLDHMAARARRIGGSLRIVAEQAGSGTRVELWLPVPAPSAQGE
jgi:signal transduction histidine kinase